MNVKLFFNQLNNFVYPFFQNCKNAVHGFDKLLCLKKVLRVATPIFRGFAVIVACLVVFRIYSWLRPGQDPKADRVQYIVNRKKYVPPVEKEPEKASTPHPAENPTINDDLISECPKEILLAIFSHLDERSLLKIGRTSRKFLDISYIACERLAKARLGLTLAVEFAKTRGLDLDVDFLEKRGVTLTHDLEKPKGITLAVDLQKARGLVFDIDLKKVSGVTLSINLAKAEGVTPTPDPEKPKGPTLDVVNYPTQLEKNKRIWRVLIGDLVRPLRLSSELHELAEPDYYANEDDLKLVSTVYENLERGNAEDLRRTLINLKEADKLAALNHCWSKHRYTPLEVAARSGNVEKARLLIDYGAKDAIIVGYPFKDYENGCVSSSALFCAAKEGKVEMVKFLLEKGARIDLKFSGGGFNKPLFSTLTKEIYESPDTLECILLIVNAWKTKVGSKIVCQDEDAKLALKKAIEWKRLKIANLLLGVGVGADVSKDVMKQIVVHDIAIGRLEFIKFLHTRDLMDLKNYREMTGETFLHTAVAYKSNKVLKYLIDEVKIPRDIVNSVGETYEVSGKKELHQRIRQLIAYGRRSSVKEGYPYEFAQGDGNKIPLFHMNFFEILEECQKKGVGFNELMNNKGQTVLHIVVQGILDSSLKLEYGTINMLIKNGADPQISDKQRLTPLKMVENALSHTNHEKQSRAQTLIKEMTPPYLPPSYDFDSWKKIDEQFNSASKDKMSY